MDPIKTCDWDEIEVPASIQDLIERNIRTLSNSISNKSDKDYSASFVNFGGSGTINVGNGSANGATLDLRDLKERWLTKKENFLLINERTTAGN